MRLIGLGFLLFLPAQLFACYWDQDTLRNEAHAMPDVVQAAVGRFPRNPDLFYQMRIDRESKEIALHPERLDLYDDLAVANDRLGKDDQALRWIEAKRSRMGDMSSARTVAGKRDAFSEAAYRYYANAGTIWLVKWMRGGGKELDLAQLKRSDELISRAIQINLNAHFGRETVQLQFIKWLLECKQLSYKLPFSSYLELTGVDSKIDQFKRPKDVKGLIGLIVLGAGWESPDLFEALSERVAGSKAQNGKLSVFVKVREEALLAEGKKSLGDYKDWSLRDDGAYDYDMIRSNYRKLKSEADAWQADRTAFMMGRLSGGSHPDTDPHFWDGYREKSAPEIDWSIKDDLGVKVKLIIFGLACLLFALIFSLVARKRRLNPATQS